MPDRRKIVLIVERDSEHAYSRVRELGQMSGTDLLLARTLESGCYLSKTFKPYKIILSESLTRGHVGHAFHCLREGNPDASVFLTAA